MYGGKRAFVRWWWARTQAALGRFQRARVSSGHPAASELIFVCQGNICRSIFAERVARSFGIPARSCGLNAGAGDPANPVALSVAAGHFGLSLSEHSSRPVEKMIDELDSFNRDSSSQPVWVVFEPEHISPLTAFLRRRKMPSDVVLLGMNSTPISPLIQDPYGLTSTCFEQCFRIIESGVRRLARTLDLMPAVLVTDVDTMGSVAVIRSLGNAGYRVIGESSIKNALGCSSRFLSERVTLKRSGDNWLGSEILEAPLMELIHQKKLKLIIASESFMLGVREFFPRIAPLLPYDSDPSITYAGFSKFDLSRSTSSHHSPPTLLIDAETGEPSAQELSGLGSGPFFIKADSVHSLSSAPGCVVRAADAGEAMTKLAELRHSYTKLVIQSYVGGVGVGAFFNVHNGQVITEFMHRRLHEFPHTGGVSSLRTPYFNQQIRDDAVDRLTSMRWEGPAMVEYRMDERTGAFYLMEINSRFWGSLHLPLWNGIDFPKDLADLHLRQDYVLGSVTIHLVSGGKDKSRFRAVRSASFKQIERTICIYGKVHGWITRGPVMRRLRSAVNNQHNLGIIFIKNPVYLNRITDVVIFSDERLRVISKEVRRVPRSGSFCAEKDLTEVVVDTNNRKSSI